MPENWICICLTGKSVSRFCFTSMEVAWKEETKLMTKGYIGNYHPKEFSRGISVYDAPFSTRFFGEK